MRLGPFKRDFFRAATTTAAFTPKIRPTMGGLRSRCCQGPLSRNLKGSPWDIVSQSDMLPIPAGEERRYGARGKRPVKPRGISSVESLNRHKGKEEIDPLHRHKSQSAQASWDSSRVTFLRCARGDQARFAAHGPGLAAASVLLYGSAASLSSTNEAKGVAIQEGNW